MLRARDNLILRGKSFTAVAESTWPSPKVRLSSMVVPTLHSIQCYQFVRADILQLDFPDAHKWLRCLSDEYEDYEHYYSTVHFPKSLEALLLFYQKFHLWCITRGLFVFLFKSAIDIFGIELYKCFIVEIKGKSIFSAIKRARDLFCFCFSHAYQ